jgi:hypothetical protein
LGFGLRIGLLCCDSRTILSLRVWLALIYFKYLQVAWVMFARPYLASQSCRLNTSIPNAPLFNISLIRHRNGALDWVWFEVIIGDRPVVYIEFGPTVPG